MRKEYKQELAQLEVKMVQAEAFAAKLPIFEHEIIKGKYSEYENSINFGNNYKQLYCGWGIRRHLFSSGSNRTVMNYKGKDYSKYLFSIYINSYSLFGHHHDFGLDDVCTEVRLFYYDRMNSTFYADDKQITDLLEALNTWYIEAQKENLIYIATQAKKKAQDDLAEAEKLLKEVS